MGGPIGMVWQQLGLPGIIGGVIGIVVLSSDNGKGTNILGWKPIPPFPAGMLGAFVIGFAIWVVIGFMIGLQAGV